MSASQCQGSTLELRDTHCNLNCGGKTILLGCNGTERPVSHDCSWARRCDFTLAGRVLPTFSGLNNEVAMVLRITLNFASALKKCGK